MIATNPDPQEQIKKLKEELEQLQKKKAASAETIKSEGINLKQWDDEIKGKDTELAALQQQLNEQNLADSAIAAEREANAKELTESDKVIAQREAQLNALLPEKRRADIAAAVNTVSGDIRNTRDEAHELKARLDRAETNLAELQSRGNASAETLQAAQSALKNLAGRMRDARQKVTKRRAAVEAAYSSGNHDQAFYLLGDLKAESARLKEMGSPEEVERLKTDVIEKRATAETDKRNVKSKTEERDKLKTRYKVKDVEATEKDTNREKLIMEELASLPDDAGGATTQKKTRNAGDVAIALSATAEEADHNR